MIAMLASILIAVVVFLLIYAGLWSLMLLVALLGAAILVTLIIKRCARQERKQS
ncbi:MAG: hypothetical protein HY645_09235 [Acidobacteria bacterium]|nr:hypothetical protein [Acidobacteriota bacterium]